MTQLDTNTTRIAESPSSAPAAGQQTPLAEQGQDRTRVPWYAAALCRVGIHAGQWEYLAEGQCTQMRVCPRCGATKVRTKHQREWRYVSDGKCEQVRTCKRCEAASGYRTRHEKWSEPWDAGRDRAAHRCLRCGVVETWSTANYD